jgi:radical SAM protein with 4Fe4S-binding SPASM domain
MLIVKPDWHFRFDPTNVIIYKQDPDGQVFDGFIVHPVVASLLAMFDGTRTIEEICRNTAYIFDRSIDFAKKTVDRYVLGLCKNALTEADDSYQARSKPLPDPVQLLLRYKTVEFDPLGRFWAPYSIAWDITWACPRRCRYCYAETYEAPSQEILPLDRALSVVDEMAEIGVLSCYLGGGDAFTYPGIEDVVMRMLAKGVTAPILTTKCRLSEEVVASFASAGLQYFQVSLDSADPAMVEFLTDSRGYLEDAIHNLQLLSRYGMKIRVNAIQTSYNCSSAGDLIDMLAHYNVYQISLTPYGITHYRHNDDKLFLSPEDKENLDRIAEQARLKYPEIAIRTPGIYDPSSLTVDERKARWKNTARCSAGRFAFCLLPDGRVIPCEQMPTKKEIILGDLRTQSLLEVWTSDRLTDVLFPQKEAYAGQPCYDCSEFDRCRTYGFFCMRDAPLHFGKFHAPNQMCPKAETKVRTM